MFGVRSHSPIPQQDCDVVQIAGHITMLWPQRALVDGKSAYVKLLRLANSLRGLQQACKIIDVLCHIAGVRTGELIDCERLSKGGFRLFGAISANEKLPIVIQCRCNRKVVRPFGPLGKLNSVGRYGQACRIAPRGIKFDDGAIKRIEAWIALGGSGIVPAGDVKVGQKDYAIDINNTLNLGGQRRYLRPIRGELPRCQGHIEQRVGTGCSCLFRSVRLCLRG